MGRFFLLTLLVVWGATAWSAEPIPGEKALQELAARYKAVQEKVYADAEKVTDWEARNKLFRERDPANTMYAEFLKLEEQHRGSVTGLSALHHLVSIAFGGYGGHSDIPATAGAQQALEILTAHYGDDPDLDVFFPWLRGRASSRQAKALLQRALKSPHRHVRGTALLALGEILTSEATVPQTIEATLELIQEAPEKFPMENKLWARSKAAWANVDSDASHREALQVLNQVISEYGDVLEAPRTTYGPMMLKVEHLSDDPLTKTTRRQIAVLAEAIRVELTKLGIGQQAPDISGPDAFGSDMTLSQHRGKVVVLMFSFKGCGPCESMYPDNRKLVDAYRNRPFQIVGVMGDQELATVEEAVMEKKITWPVWWDGPGTKGPLATRWNVVGWPEIFVLDHEGVIRYRELRGEMLSRAVAKLVEAAENGSK